MAKNDVKIKQLMAVLEAKKAALGTRPKEVLVTNGLFEIEGARAVNINTITDKRIFVNLLATLLQRQQMLEVAAEMLEVDFSVESDTISGYTIQEWKKDFAYRVSVIQYEEKKKELDKLQRTLDSLVSEELRTEVELEKIEQLLK